MTAAAALLRRIECNRAGRDFVVGDIHGYFHVLEALLEHIGFDRHCDRLFSVGDLIDRGPESDRVSEFLLQPWFYAIRGNHEQMLLQGAHTAARTPAYSDAAALWTANGGEWFFRMPGHEQADIYRDVSQLAYAIEVALGDGRAAALVHADVLDDSWRVTRDLLAGAEADEPQDALMRLLWARSRAFEVQRALDGAPARRVPVDGIDVIFFGHTPMPRPVACGNTRWIDAGVAQANRLALAELAVDGRVWSMPRDLRAPPEPGWAIVTPEPEPTGFAAWRAVMTRRRRRRS